eukprot:c4531_g1_i3.p1 GENE.c4531_g1_i3~~c4531_g1_i3.p1  ORF type:complete len:343 (+),score=66.04 c4531_g1_i3:205-1233(+)
MSEVKRFEDKYEECLVDDPPDMQARREQRAIRSLSLTGNLENIKRTFGGKPLEELAHHSAIVEQSEVCSQITLDIFLGSDKVAQQRELLLENHVTHILNVTGQVSPNYHAGDESFKYLTLFVAGAIGFGVCLSYFDVLFHSQSKKCADDLGEDIVSNFYDALEFMIDATKDNHKLFVHCWQGVSRSASFVIMFLMLTHDFSFDEAFTMVHERRSVAAPNPSFNAQIKKWFTRLIDGVSTPVFYKIQPRRENHEILRPAIQTKFDKNSLDTNTCCLVQTKTHLFIWKGANAPPEVIEIAAKHARLLQQFEHASSVCHWLNEDGQDDDEAEGVRQEFENLFNNL